MIPSLSHLRLITFDCTNTLLKFRKPPGQVYFDALSIVGSNVEIDPNHMTTNFKKQWMKMNSEHPNFGLASIGWESWWRKIVENCFKDSNKGKPFEERELRELSTYLILMFERFDYWNYNDGSLELVSYLLNKKKQLGIISNFDPRLHSVLKDGDLYNCFDFVLTSYEAGVEKPSKIIFKKAEELSKLHNFNPSEAVHIGNDVNLDYFGAKSVGWNSVLLSSENPVKIKEENEHLNVKDVYSSLSSLKRYWECKEQQINPK